MADPTTRVLALLELLQSEGRVSGPALAKRLGVDPRTVRRYVARLEEIGIPVTAERGRDGFYALVAGYKLPPMMFTADEAVALSIGLLAARGLGLADGAAAVASAQAKLSRVMPEALKRRIRGIEETVTLDLSAPAAPAGGGALAALSAAAQSRTRVTLRYRARGGEETERGFDTYGLVYRGGCWYAVGRCDAGLRTFRLDRVLDVRPGTTGFARPEGFDALRHLVVSVATLPRAFSADVLLETDLARARHELFPAAGILETVPGGVLLRIQADDLKWVALELSRLPFRFTVLRPAALRRALAAHAETLRTTARRSPGSPPYDRQPATGGSTRA